MLNYMDLCEVGEATLEEIDYYIDVWHEGTIKKPLHAFLGMTKREFKIYMKDKNYLKQIVELRKARNKASTS